MEILTPADLGGDNNSVHFRPKRQRGQSQGLSNRHNLEQYLRKRLQIRWVISDLTPSPSPYGEGESTAEL